MAKKNKNKFVYIIIGILSLIAIGYFGSQQFTLLDEGFQTKYTFEDNKVDTTHNDIRLVPVLYKYSGTQMTWGWFNANRNKELPVYGSISSNYYLEGGIANKYDKDIISYDSRDSYTAYCQELGHANALSTQFSQEKDDAFAKDLEDCDRNSGDYPNDCTYWNKKSYDSYYTTNIWCYNDNEFTKYYKFQTVEPVITDGFYNTFELQYDVTLNNQKVKPFIIIDNVTYRLDSNNQIEFEDTKVVNTKVYYGFEMLGDGTQTPIIRKDIKLVPSFTEKEEETQGSVIDEPIVVDTEEPLTEDITTSNTVPSIGGEDIVMLQQEPSYTIVYIIAGVLVLIGGISLFL